MCRRHVPYAVTCDVIHGAAPGVLTPSACNMGELRRLFKSGSRSDVVAFLSPARHRDIGFGSVLLGRPFVYHPITAALSLCVSILTLAHSLLTPCSHTLSTAPGILISMASSIGCMVVRYVVTIYTRFIPVHLSSPLLDASSGPIHFLSLCFWVSSFFLLLYSIILFFISFTVTNHLSIFIVAAAPRSPHPPL